MCWSLVAQGLCAGALAEALFAGEARGPPETSAPYAVLEDAFHSQEVSFASFGVTDESSWTEHPIYHPAHHFGTFFFAETKQEVAIGMSCIITPDTK